MTRYIVKQRLKLGGESFIITDDHNQSAYVVKGSFMTVPKTFTIFNAEGQEVSRLVKPSLNLIPRFEVKMTSGHSFTIQKKLTFLKDKYDIVGLGLSVDGNIWDTSFSLRDDTGIEVAHISKKLFYLTSTYDVDIVLSDYTDLVISLVIAIDYVEMLEGRR